MKIIKTILAIVSVILLYEFAVGIRRKLNRRKIFTMAKERSRVSGLPLLVIGDPYNGVMSVSTGPDYGCGNLCIDLTGCPRCPRGKKGYLENVLPAMGGELSNYIVYISCTLEYVDNLPKILTYLINVPYDNIFIVNIEWYCLTSYLYPYFLTNEQPPKYVIYQCPPSKPIFKYKELWGTKTHKEVFY